MKPLRRHGFNHVKDRTHTSGYRILKKIDWSGVGILDEDPTSADCECATAGRYQNHGDIKNALVHITKAISLSAPENTQLGRYYETRARLLDTQHDTKSAISDASMAVKIGGLAYIPLEVDLLVRDGHIDTAIGVLKDGITVTKFERERSLFELLTAKLYLQSNRFLEAVQSAKRCISSEEQPDYHQKNRMPSYMGPYFYEVERLSAPAYVVKAKAESAFGQFDEARLDAETAASKFFDIAQIRCRDNMLDWARTLPVTQHVQ